MSTVLPELSQVEETLYLTLCLRALDYRRPMPILGDATADKLVRELGYDAERFGTNASNVLDVALRAKILDEVVRRFVDRYPTAIGIDLGCGLDDRTSRLDLPATVDWYDVDFPAVIAAREKLLPRRPNVHAIGTDLADLEWLDALPADRPAVIVADGLMAFLTEDVMRALLTGLAEKFPHGELAFNAYTRFHVFAVRHYRGTASIAGVAKSPGFDDPRFAEQWSPRFELVEELMVARRPEVAQFPTWLRLANRLAAASTSLARKGTNVLRYRFGPTT